MVHNSRLLKNILVYGLGLLPLSDFAEALQTYPLVDHHKTDIKIAAHHQTRIAVLEDRIAQIFGAEGLLDVQSDEEQGQLFLKPLDPSSTQPVLITIVTEKGLTQDLTLVPHPGESDSVLFKPALGITDPARPQTLSRDETILAFLEFLVSAPTIPTKNSSYTRRSLGLQDRAFPETLMEEPLFVYESADYTGRVIRLRNTTTGTLMLTESAFAQKGDVAITILSKVLAPKEATRIFIISHREDTP